MRRAAPPPADTGPRAPVPPKRKPLTGVEALALYRPGLSESLRMLEVPGFRHQQVYEHLMQHPSLPLEACTSLPPALRSQLATATEIQPRTELRVDDARQTTRLLVALADGCGVESVIMRYPDRTTVCVSTQVGCAMRCAFCATGSVGFTRNLHTSEIIDQVRLAASIVVPEGRRVTNVVFMGMGEPMLNREAVLAALRLLQDPRGLHVRARGLSVSTVGIPEGIVELARREPQVNLALSLHAPTDELRGQLVPVNSKYPICTVLRATDTHFAITHRKLLVEYVLLNGVNDRPTHAQQLSQLLRGRVAAVNLIAWNATGGPFRAPDPAAVTAFQAELQRRHVDVSLRARMGHSIQGACGQLMGRRNRGQP